jgi:AMMECR1 domain-containing protein/predicted class III extradiol MEMO1 family dioxygenase
MNIFSAIIPHAGKKYAGQARKKIFDYILKTSTVKIKYIIYIASIHHIPSNHDGYVYLLYKDFDIGGDFVFKKYPSSEHEHSYEWVKDELDTNFPQTKRIVIGPVTSIENVQKSLSNEIARFILKNASQGILLLGTTDLIHYGKMFGNSGSLKYPERQTKIYKEENLIMNMIESSYDEIEKKSSIMCGPYAVEMFTYINSLLFGDGPIVMGNVLDYYDSSVYDKKGIDKYVIYPTSTNEFVSYVSIIYDFGISIPKRAYPFKNNIDDTLSLAFVKSILLQNLTKRDYVSKLNLPKFHSFHRMRGGVFVGTSLNGNVNSCYGRFEEESFKKSSLADNIIYAASMCISDSIERWNNPITLSNINHLTFKIDILDERKEWRILENSKFINSFVVDGSYGVYLTLPNEISATYLPSVAFDYKNRWSSEKYIKSLTQKAGGIGDEWRDPKTKIQLYKTKTIESK